jgi:hypothetical protein
MRFDSIELLKRYEYANIKRLQYIRIVRRYDQKINLILYIVGYKITLNITPMTICNK